MSEQIPNDPSIGGPQWRQDSFDMNEADTVELDPQKDLPQLNPKREHRRSRSDTVLLKRSSQSRGQTGVRAWQSTPAPSGSTRGSTESSRGSTESSGWVRKGPSEAARSSSSRSSTSSEDSSSGPRGLDVDAEIDRVRRSPTSPRDELSSVSPPDDSISDDSSSSEGIKSRFKGFIGKLHSAVADRIGNKERSPKGWIREGKSIAKSLASPRNKDGDSQAALKDELAAFARDYARAHDQDPKTGLPDGLQDLIADCGLNAFQNDIKGPLVQDMLIMARDDFQAGRIDASEVLARLSGSGITLTMAGDDGFDRLIVGNDGELADGAAELVEAFALHEVKTTGDNDLGRVLRESTPATRMLTTYLRHAAADWMNELGFNDKYEGLKDYKTEEGRPKNEVCVEGEVPHRMLNDILRALPSFPKEAGAVLQKIENACIERQELGRTSLGASYQPQWLDSATNYAFGTLCLRLISPNLLEMVKTNRTHGARYASSEIQLYANYAGANSIPKPYQ